MVFDLLFSKIFQGICYCGRGTVAAKETNIAEGTVIVGNENVVGILAEVEFIGGFPVTLLLWWK
jgi:hypothetical protein